MTQSAIGQTKKLQCSFSDPSGTLVDPTSITLKIGIEDGDDVTLLETVAIGGLTKSSTGVYYYYYTPAAAGRFHFEFASGGDEPTVVSRGTFDVSVAVF
jgi:hypothetical protein